MLLLIVDMQEGLFDQTPRYDAQGVIARINDLIACFKKAGQPIVFIRHNGPKADALEPHTPGWEILKELDKDPSDPVIDKWACDAFVHTPLSDLLEQLNETDLVITGCATDFCVDTTIRSAAGKGYKVIAASDGHTTADRPHLDARTIITHHNWSWENLILDTAKGQSPIQVKPCAEIEKEVS